MFLGLQDNINGQREHERGLSADSFQYLFECDCAQITLSALFNKLFLWFSFQIILVCLPNSDK